MRSSHLALGLLSAGAALALWAGSANAAKTVEVDVTPLVTNSPQPPATTDPHLINPWGVSNAPGNPFWVSDNGTGFSTLYTGGGAKVPLNVTIPPSSHSPPGSTGVPTGTVFNPSVLSGGTSFQVAGSTPIFLFATEDGTVSGWNFGTGTPPGSAAAIGFDSTNGAVFKGLALAPGVSGHDLLYATDFHNGQVDMFTDQLTAPTTTGFVDPNLPKGFAPFNDAVINGEVYVTYAKQNLARHDDVAGVGNGFVDVFHLDGSLDKRLISNGALNSPWGLAIAPSSFGSLAGDLLVGNFGDGFINAYDPNTGLFEGTLVDRHGNPIDILGLWTLTQANGALGSNPNKIYFTAGGSGEDIGIFGTLTPVPEPEAWLLMCLGVGALGAMLRAARRSHALTIA